VADERTIMRGEVRNSLREWRRLTGLSQVQVDRYFGWGKSRLSHIENGRALLTDDVLKLLADLYKCEPADLLRAPPNWRRRTIGRGANYEEPPAALPDTIAMLRALSEEMRSLKRDLMPRLDMLEEQIAATTTAAITAVQNAADVTAMFERGLDCLKTAIDPQMSVVKSRRRVADITVPPPKDGDGSA
jgi:transcriptional regulator with XRE-family HTH domain